MSIQSFRCKETQLIYEGVLSKRFNNIRPVVERKLQMLDDAVELKDLASPPGNRLEQLSGNRAGQHSIRVNDQWRMSFKWGDHGPEDVELTDYH